MSSGASVRNRITAAVLARVQGINGSGNYVTSLGTNNPRVWRKAPFSFGELPEVSINDEDEDVSQGPPMSLWTPTLDFTIWIAIGENLSTDSDSSLNCTQFMKDAFADLDFAIGTTTDGQPGRYWSVSGTRLAVNTIPGKRKFIVDQAENIIALGEYHFQIQYRTPAFSPNTVQL